jgi:D-alanyl-D-alanine carboxypeptidase
VRRAHRAAATGLRARLAGAVQEGEFQVHLLGAADPVVDDDPVAPRLKAARIGSVTKTFVTTLLLRLHQEGRLSLDDPIDRYVTGVPGGEEITLRQLANMTSGLADYFGNEQFTFEYLTGETFTPDHLVELGLELPPRFAPGTEWSYSNTNTALIVW